MEVTLYFLLLHPQAVVGEREQARLMQALHIQELD
jgi:hypothetical protein